MLETSAKVNGVIVPIIAMALSTLSRSSENVRSQYVAVVPSPSGQFDAPEPPLDGGLVAAGGAGSTGVEGGVKESPSPHDTASNAAEPTTTAHVAR